MLIAAEAARNLMALGNARTQLITRGVPPEIALDPTRLPDHIALNLAGQNDEYLSEFARGYGFQISENAGAAKAQTK